MSHRYSKKKRKTNLQKSNEFISMVNSVKIDDVSYRTVLDQAIDYRYDDATLEYKEKDLKAIMVNNIRHNYSNYDENLSDIRKLKRSHNDYRQYKNSVLQKIADKYPYLESECMKQKHNINMIRIKG